MRRMHRLLLSLPLLATTACAADAIAGPELAPQPEAVALAEAVLDEVVVAAPQPGEVPVRPAVFICRATALSPRPTERLHLVDGVVTDADVMRRLDPNDIRTIEVIKGPAAAALYGTRAALGVVIITTRRGGGG